MKRPAPEPGRRVTAAMLLAAAALDLTRCGLVATTDMRAGKAAALVSAGLAVAAVTLWTARGCRRGTRWSGVTAFLIGTGSAPQAAASGFSAAYTIPDAATAVLGVLVPVGVLATAGRARQPGPSKRRKHMLDRLDRFSRPQPAPDADVITRAVAVPALAALAVIHVVDLPGTLGPDRLVGIGYLGIIAGAIIAGGAMIARSHWLAWAAAGGLAVAAMAGYVLTRSLAGGFLGDHGDVGNWRCPLGIAALSVEALIILLAAGRAWQARARAASRAAKIRSAGPRAAEYSRPR